MIQKHAREFLLDCVAGNLSKDTIRTYREVLSSVVKFAGDRDVTSELLRRYLVHLKTRQLSEHTIAKHDRHLRSFFAWCDRQGYCNNVMKAIRKPKTSLPVSQTISNDDLHKLLVACNVPNPLLSARDKAILLFLIETGCRRSEVVSLKMKSVNLNQLSATVSGKTGRRMVYFSEVVADAIRRWVSIRGVRSEWVFTSVRAGVPLQPNAVNQLVKRIKKQSGVTARICPQLFRNSFARNYVKAGGDLSTLSKLLGHSSIVTTHNHYLSLTDEDIESIYRANNTPLDF
jgi:integrase/recombinase XerD